MCPEHPCDRAAPKLADALFRAPPNEPRSPYVLQNAVTYLEQIGVLDMPVSRGLNRHLVTKRFLADLLIVSPELTLERCLNISDTLEMVTTRTVLCSCPRIAREY